jgi:16S rRNA (guanine966-N2)-methyltransferase
MPGPRVIAGLAKGLRLHMVPGGDTRPIGDRPKEALFNIIGMGIQDSRFLDLFAGTGSVGIEALSRGATLCVFLDIQQIAIRTIRDNLQITGLDQSALVLRKDAFLYLRSEIKQTFDFIYIAPPQYHGMWERALLAVDEGIERVNPDAWVIVQIDPDEYTSLTLDHLIEFDSRRYGNTLLVFYEYPGR